MIVSRFAVLLVVMAGCTTSPSGDGGGLVRPDSGPGLDAGFQPDASKVIRAATFNVHRFFDTQCQSSNCDVGDYEEVLDESEFESRATTIATGIRALNADVIALQEIETGACMDALQTRLMDRFNVFVLGETGGSASVDVAIIARGVLVETRSHENERLERADGGITYFSRDLLEVHLDLDGERVIMFAAHFRSKFNDDAERRLLEAQHAHDLVLQSADEFREATVILAGDLNDTPGSPPINALLGDGRIARTGAELPEGEQWTWRSSSSPADAHALDHVLYVTPQSDYLSESAGAHRGSDDTGWYGSDHAAWSAAFDLN